MGRVNIALRWCHTKYCVTQNGAQRFNIALCFVARKLEESCYNTQNGPQRFKIHVVLRFVARKLEETCYTTQWLKNTCCSFADFCCSGRFRRAQPQRIFQAIPSVTKCKLYVSPSCKVLFAVVARQIAWNKAKDQGCRKFHVARLDVQSLVLTAFYPTVRVEYVKVQP